MYKLQYKINGYVKTFEFTSLYNMIFQVITDFENAYLENIDQVILCENIRKYENVNHNCMISLLQQLKLKKILTDQVDFKLNYLQQAC